MAQLLSSLCRKALLGHVARPAEAIDGSIRRECSTPVSKEWKTATSIQKMARSMVRAVNGEGTTAWRNVRGEGVVS